MSSDASATRQEIHDELERVRADFRDLVAATPAELRRPSSGTRWTNGQLLFHMFFGYLIVRRLLPLVRLMGRLPEPVSRTFARVLEAGTRPFHLINHQSDRGAARVLHGPRLTRWFDRTLDVLQAQLATGQPS
ncbi:maleylpyruvate isomerase N-terminal domain-containing protein [Kocuria sp. NPDC057446]|uniref:maleylpyruvate isomerase N-terminal domain-containing protein n=1 Tax=Kocuria sp. NPDC057446 TaxID=3346137 RepID=UPI0036AB10F3